MTRIVHSFVLAFAATTAAFAQAAVPAGYVQTSFLGVPTVEPLLKTYMSMQVDAILNSPVDSLGGSNPMALANQLLGLAQSFCGAHSSEAIPDCSTQSAVVAPFQQQILTMAAFVPAGQWAFATFDDHLPGTIAQAVAYAAANAPKPPPPPPSGPRVGPCYSSGATTVCSGGAGSTLQNTADGQTVTQDGKQYTAHITQTLMGSQLWFSPAN